MGECLPQRHQEQKIERKMDVNNVKYKRKI
jgi:hypothetical protein